ncbi:MAG TPA: BamA/TamA family outer membrane protein [Planctomycetota bacterium]|nr:BamA/TamA family outer membrane protein [Planctomycetota bacterium]
MAEDPMAEPAQDHEHEVPFDPFRGMDRDGRIPKVPLPADLEHPDRWRYVPEGRIKPGSMLERFWVTSFISPILYFEEDVGLGGGVAITDIDFRQQRRQEFAGLFMSTTTEGQERYSFVWQRWLNHRNLPDGGVITEERSHLRGGMGYDRSLTRRFYGLGSRSVADDETSYADEVSYAQLMMQLSVPNPGDDVVMQIGGRVEHRNLHHGYVGGQPSTGEIYPELVEAGDSYDSVWVHGALRYDSRDSQENPYRGWLAEVGVDLAPLQHGDGIDGNQIGAVWNASATWTIPVPGIFHNGGVGNEENPPTDTFAVGAHAWATSGDLPFWALPSLGGSDTLRGYIGNRFTDRAAWHAAAEWRIWAIPRGAAITDTVRFERFGFAFFYELGTVAERLSAFDDARMHHSYGFGLRILLERTALFRADFGWADEGMAFNLSYGLSF